MDTVKSKKINKEVVVKLNISLNEEQKLAKANILNNTITFLTGNAGSGKTMLACEIALNMLFKKQINKIIITRPAVEAGEKLGALPGGIEEKLDPYLQAIYQNLYTLYKKEHVLKYVEEGKIEIVPFAYMRGRTFVNSFIIVDEVQNTSVSQTKMVLERIGYNSKMVLCGDITQQDSKGDSGVRFLNYLYDNKLKNFNKIVLKTNHRNEIVEDMLNLHKSFL
jgi:phosphate starvation-inducible PhoH-like protein